MSKQESGAAWIAVTVVFGVLAGMWLVPQFAQAQGVPAAGPVRGTTASFSGAAGFANGTVGAPSIYWTADADGTGTGIYRPAANQVGIATNGVRRILIDENGSTTFTGGAAGAQGWIFDHSGSNTGAVSMQVNGAIGQTGHAFVYSQGGVGAMYELTANGSIELAGNLHFSNAAPTISSGFGTSPSVTAGRGSSFRVNVGTGGVATSGVIAMNATAANGWNCDCEDITTSSATVFRCKQTAGTTTTATFGNFNTSGAAAAWVASDVLAITCTGY
jgi:hypothetical protein